MIFGVKRGEMTAVRLSNIGLSNVSTLDLASGDPKCTVGQLVLDLIYNLFVPLVHPLSKGLPSILIPLYICVHDRNAVLVIL